jgi:hypothetical protein
MVIAPNGQKESGRQWKYTEEENASGETLSVKINEVWNLYRRKLPSWLLSRKDLCCFLLLESGYNFLTAEETKEG